MKGDRSLAEPRRVSHNFSAFLDSRPGVPANERYKAVGGGLRKLYRLVSADGIRWRNFAEESLFWSRPHDVDRAQQWKKKSDLRPLVGRAIKVRFLLKDADLYSLRFAP